MMQYKPFLKLNRLVVLKGTNIVYDEKFHSGVNIIRGEKNSVGKTTIASMIFYALGGEGVVWVEEAKSCDYVIAEIQINDAAITAKREISEQKERGMAIFWGPYDQAQKSNITEWQSYPFSHKGQRQTFSQVLFRALGIPEVKGINLSAQLTLNQLLRLIYVDQLTSPKEIFRHEDFSSSNLLEAIGWFLCGAYDERIYEIGSLLKEKELRRDEIKGQLKAICKILKDEVQVGGPEFIKSKITKVRDELKAEYEKVRNLNVEIQKTQAKTQPEIEAIGTQLGKIKNEIYEIESERQQLLFEISDSELFISALEQKLDALDDSQEIFNILGQAEFNFCPACLAVINTKTDKGICSLCKSPQPTEKQAVHLMRIKQEIALQLTESQDLYKAKKAKYDNIMGKLPQLLSKRECLQLDYDNKSKTVQSNFDSSLSKSYSQIGYLNRQIEDLEKDLTLANSIEQLETEQADLVKELEKLYMEKNKREENQKLKADKATKSIVSNLESIITKDLPGVESTFQRPDEITFDFKNNSVSVNGRSNYSASSQVILKNSFHLALSLASAQNDFFRYPRFVLFDDIEDKGMTPERSQNFQRLIVELSGKTQVEHQIIFTTSLVDPELNKLPWAVGEFYTPSNKSLKIKSV